MKKKYKPALSEIKDAGLVEAIRRKSSSRLAEMIEKALEEKILPVALNMLLNAFYQILLKSDQVFRRENAERIIEILEQHGFQEDADLFKGLLN